MEMRAGFKKTEIGVIPEDWEALPASAIGAFKGGSGFPLDVQGDRRGDYPFFKVSDMNHEGNETFMSIANHYISEHTRKRLGATAFPPESIVFAKVGAAVFLERKKILSQPSCIDNNMAALVLDKHCADFRYVHSLLLSKKLGDLVATTALPALNGKVLGTMVLAIPPLPEQRAIATALSDVDALLDGLDRLIAKKRDLKQAAMQQLLTGQARLPGFQGGWEVRPLECFISSDRFAIVDGPFGSQLKVGDYVESGIPVVEMEHLLDKVISEQIQRRITAQKFEELKRSAVYAGDIIVSKTGSLGKLGIVPESLERGIITSRLAKITVDPKKANLRFVFQCLLKLRHDRYWEKISQGGTMQILGIDMLKHAPIPDISVAEQAAIAAVLSDMDTEIAALEARRGKTRALKQGMMQELLTGRIRLV